MKKRIAGIAAAAGILMLLPALAHAAGFDVKAATDAYLATVTGTARAQSDAYFEGGYWLILWDALATIAACLLLLFTRASAGIRNFAERSVSRRWLQTYLYAALFILALAILAFPLTIYEGFYREHAYGLSNMEMTGWLRDYGIGLALQLVFGGLFFTLVYAVIRLAPRNWWLLATVATGALFILQFAVAPILISPLFNDYKPMADGPVKAEILSIARANGVPTDQVFEFNASRQSKRVSANVSGFLGTTRISLTDNLLTRATPAEVKAVMAHEIGHYVLNHGAKIIVYLTLLAGVAFVFASGGFGVLQRALGGAWDVRDIGDPAGFPILVILLTIFNVAATPVQNSIIRENEAQADLFGLNAAREPDAFSTAILKLAEYRKLDPTPLEEIAFYDHPSGRSRITMAMRWKAERLNEFPSPASAAAAPRPAPAKEMPPQGPDVP